MKKLSDFSDGNRLALHNVGVVLLRLVDESGQPIYSPSQIERIVDRLDRTPGAQHVAFWNPVLERWVAVSEGSEPSFTVIDEPAFWREMNERLAKEMPTDAQAEATK